MGEGTTRYNLLVVLAVCVGSFTYGYCASILGNTFSKPSFFEYMNLDLEGPGLNYTDMLIALWNCLLYVGGFFGCSIYTWFSSKYGRRVPLVVGCVCVIVGGALQAGEVNAAMLAIARVITGLGLGIFLPGCPLYQAEVAPPHSRGLMVGLHACLVAGGFAVAQWIGVAFFYVEGQVNWRAPLALQCVAPIVLLCLIYFLPESPRWLYLNGEHGAAERVLIALHKGNSDPTDSFSRNEFLLMKAQLDLEAEDDQSISRVLKDPHLRKRFIIGWLTMTTTQCSGSIVILRFTPFLIVLMTAVWCVVLTAGNFAGSILVDKIGRVRQMTIGLLGCFSCLVLSAVLTALYAGTDNEAGNRAATFFVFLFVCFYSCGIEVPSFVYTSEVFPVAWRASGVAFSMSAVFIWSAIFTGVASSAFQNIHWKFYIVFACMTLAMAVIVYIFFPETKGYSLEQVSQVFGDPSVRTTSGGEIKDVEVQAHVEHRTVTVFDPPNVLIYG